MQFRKKLYTAVAGIATAVLLGSFVFAQSAGFVLQSGTTFFGHMLVSGSQPAVSACGAGSLDTNAVDMAGTLTMSSNATGCTVTFVTPFAATPFCFMFDVTGSASNGPIMTPSATALTFTQLRAGQIVNYLCFGKKAG